MQNPPVSSDLETEAARLRGLYGHLDGAELLKAIIGTELDGQIMMTSSFGAEAAVLLDVVASVDTSIPVIFLDTRRLFGETFQYQRRLTEFFGLEDIRVIRPDDGVLQRLDPDDMLFTTDPDRCCEIRKVQPLDDALSELQGNGFKAWITGRKRYQSDTRGTLESIEVSQGFIKINPLVHWSDEDLKAAFREKNLPAPPLVAEGFLAIGCMP